MQWAAVEDVSIYEDARTVPSTPAVSQASTEKTATPANTRRSMRRGSYSVKTPTQVTPQVAKSQRGTPKVVESAQVTPQVVQPRQKTPQIVEPRQATPQLVRSRQATPQVVKSRQATPQLVKSRQATPQLVEPQRATPQLAKSATTGTPKRTPRARRSAASVQKEATPKQEATDKTGNLFFSQIFIISGYVNTECGMFICL